MQQRLKAALWFAVGKIVDEESLRLNTNATPQFIGALTEMVWAQIGNQLPCFFLVGIILMDHLENVSADLESFCKHAGRSTINTDDVLLITRRNDALHDIMKDFIDKESAKNGKGNARGKVRQ